MSAPDHLVDVRHVLDRSPLVLELGCGSSKRRPDAVGVDLLPGPGVDLVGDAFSVLAQFPDASVDEVYSEHFLEHLDDPRRLVEEAGRVLRDGGVFRAVVPHFSNPYFYSDPTHRSFYGLYTFGYWVDGTPFTRQVPHYDEPLPLDLEAVQLVFKSSRPFYVRHAGKKALSSWVNLSRWTQEFYEENLTGLLPCYELDYRLRRVPRDRP